MQVSPSGKEAQWEIPHPAGSLSIDSLALSVWLNTPLTQIARSPRVREEHIGQKLEFRPKARTNFL